jgi:hypothetical protein
MCTVGHKPNRQYNDKEEKKNLSLTEIEVTMFSFFSLSSVHMCERDEKTDEHKERLFTDNITTK